jgi:predicted nucleic acid-binding protein
MRSEPKRLSLITRIRLFSYTDATTFAVMQRTGIKLAFAFNRYFIQFGFALYA